MTTLPSWQTVCAFCEVPAGGGHHDLCPQAGGWVTVHGQTDEHQPFVSCAPVHCHWHNLDEPGAGYITCLECGHLYRTAGELRRAYRRQMFRIPRFGVPRWRIAWAALTARAARISFCQECIHDF